MKKGEARVAGYFASPPGEHHETLSVAGLTQPLRAANRVLLAFGYYDTPTLDKILAMTGRRASVSLVLNGLGGPALEEQREALHSLVKRHRVLRPQVRLYFSSGIFHPKLVVAVRKGAEGVAWVGSANATSAAFPEKRERNQELMVEIRGDVSALVAYFEQVLEKAIPLESLETAELRSKSLPSFFRAGALVFKPTSQLQLSFNPFSPLIRGLKAREKKALGAQSVRNSETTTGIGAFNVATAVGLREADFGDAPAKVSPLAFGFETALGYWVPAANLEAFRLKMDTSSKGKRTKLETLARLLDEAGLAGLSSRYREYLSDVERAFRAAGLAHVMTSSGATRAFDLAGGQAFLKRSLRTAAGDGFVERYARPFFISPVPEIWDDPTLTERFTESFFEGLLGAHLKGGKGARLHVRNVLAAVEDGRFGDPEPVDAADLSRCFRRYLRGYGWGELDWT